MLSSLNKDIIIIIIIIIICILLLFIFNVSCSGSITLVGEERANLSAFVYL